MTRRIDSMDGEQLYASWMRYSGPLALWLLEMTEPEPRWQDDLKKGPIICWVWDRERVNPKKYMYNIDSINPETADYRGGILSWEFAEPVRPHEIYQGGSR